MALLWMEGFDALGATNAELQLKYTSVSTAAMTTSSVAGRFIGQAYKMVGGGGSVTTFLRKDFGASSTTGTWGFAVKYDSLANAPWALGGFGDNGTTQVAIMITNGGTLRVVTGANGAVLATDTQVIPSGQWQYVEFKSTIHNTTGTVDVWLNNVNRISLTNVNTRGGTTNNSFNGITYGCIVSLANGTFYLDDIYVCDTAAGLGSSSPIGDLRVSTQMPNGNGGHSQFTRTGGTASGNFTAVDETNPEDADTSYVATNGVGNIDTYTIPALAATVTAVKGIQFNLIARKDDSGNRALAAVQRSGGSDFASAQLPNLTASYNDYITTSEVSYATGIAWTVSEVNASEFGPKIAA